MISQNNATPRNRGRHNGGRNTRPAQAGQQSAPNTQSPNNQNQWQRKYDHYCELAQAAGRDDAVTREGHWQHAEHYLRLMNGSAS